MLDYVLVVAVGISAGIGALVSACPVLQPYTLPLCLATLAFITIVNLRGVKESGVAFVIPTYLFVASLLAVLAIGIVKTLASGGHPEPVVAPAAAALGPDGRIAVDPDAVVRQRLHGDDGRRGGQQRRLGVPRAVGPVRPPHPDGDHRAAGGPAGRASPTSAGPTASAPPSPGRRVTRASCRSSPRPSSARGVFYYITIGSVLAVLALSANTGFADFPRLCRVIAQDGFLPSAFAHRGRRLVYSHGILVLAGLSGALLDPLPRDHRLADPAVRGGGVPGLHALAGGDGRALASRSGVPGRAGRWRSTAWVRSAPR